MGRDLKRVLNFPRKPIVKKELYGLLVANPGSTFLLQVSGETMEHSGIKNRDFVVVDSSLQPGRGSIVIVDRDGQYSVERSQEPCSYLRLVGSTPKATPDHKVVGVVTFHIGPLREPAEPSK